MNSRHRNELFRAVIMPPKLFWTADCLKFREFTFWTHGSLRRCFSRRFWHHNKALPARIIDEALVHRIYKQISELHTLVHEFQFLFRSRWYPNLVAQRFRYKNFAKWLCNWIPRPFAPKGFKTISGQLKPRKVLLAWERLRRNLNRLWAIRHKWVKHRARHWAAQKSKNHKSKLGETLKDSWFLFFIYSWIQSRKSVQAWMELPWDFVSWNIQRTLLPSPSCHPRPDYPTFSSVSAIESKGYNVASSTRLSLCKSLLTREFPYFHDPNTIQLDWFPWTARVSWGFRFTAVTLTADTHFDRCYRKKRDNSLPSASSL